MSFGHSLAEQARAILPEGQEHIIEHVRSLSTSDAEQLLHELEKIEWKQFEHRALAPDAASIASPAVISLADRHTLEAEVEPLGASLLRHGAVANLIVAGGQGSRLGYEGPKGCYFLEELGKYIFQIHSERHAALCEKYGCEALLLIMTGPQNDRETRDFFAEHSHFGLDSSQIVFFRQGSVPSFSPAHKLQLASPTSLVTNPNGHGGTVDALISSGTLADLARRGVKYLNYIQVDNILAPLDDCFALGLVDSRGADMLTKVVSKAAPEEKVGCLARIAGVDQIVEYSDVTPEQTRMTDSNGDLLLRWGNTALHIFSLDFLQRFESERSLPYHVSAPKAATVYTSGDFVDAEVIKYERFIFDLLLETEKTIGLEVSRVAEFAPIKNRTGADSPETACALYRNYTTNLPVE